MSRLVVVSNRVALPGKPSAGGLAVALLAALQESGGLWFGASDKTVKGDSGDTHEVTDGNIRYVTVDLNHADHNAYYNGFANRTLWPLLHSRLDLVSYTRETQAAYQQVNALFGDRLQAVLRKDDTVWIHDYHLFPLAQELRARGVGNRIGFFLHVPLPSADQMAALPDHLAVFGALSACDLVGFQTRRDLEHYQDYLRAYGGGKVHARGVLENAAGRRFHAGAFPISIDTTAIVQLAAASVRKPAMQRLRESLSGRALAIGVDRLDYSKGLPERFQAFARYLDRHAGQRGKTTMLQIAPPSRSDVPEYQALRRELEQVSGHINGSHAHPDWTPLRYVNRNYPHATLAGFYRMARVGLVTPLRDGMNLVAKEYVAAQDANDPGVLVLSRFAGAADELPQALLVNPYDLDGVADAIATAFAMPQAERRERWGAMQDTLQRRDITAWRRDFLKALKAAVV